MSLQKGDLVRVGGKIPEDIEVTQVEELPGGIYKVLGFLVASRSEWQLELFWKVQL